MLVPRDQSPGGALDSSVGLVAAEVALTGDGHDLAAMVAQASLVMLLPPLLQLPHPSPSNGPPTSKLAPKNGGSSNPQNGGHKMVTTGGEPTVGISQVPNGTGARLLIGGKTKVLDGGKVPLAEEDLAAGKVAAHGGLKLPHQPSPNPSSQLPPRPPCHLMTKLGRIGQAGHQPGPRTTTPLDLHQQLTLRTLEDGKAGHQWTLPPLPPPLLPVLLGPHIRQLSQFRLSFLLAAAGK